MSALKLCFKETKFCLRGGGKVQGHILSAPKWEHVEFTGSPAAVPLIQSDNYFFPQTSIRLTFWTQKKLICEHRIISSIYQLKLSLSKQKTIWHRS